MSVTLAGDTVTYKCAGTPWKEKEGPAKDNKKICTTKLVIISAWSLFLFLWEMISLRNPEFMTVFWNLGDDVTEWFT